MAAVVEDVIGLFLAVLDASDAAADGSPAFVVGAQFARIGQDGFQELDGYDFMPFVVDGVDAGHADILDYPEMGQVFLAEGHPEAGAFEGGIMFYQGFQFFVVHQVGFLGSDMRVVERLVDAERVGFVPLAVFPVFAALGDFADVDFGVEVGGESLAVVAGVAVHDIQVADFIEMVLGGVGGEDAGHARVEAAAEDGGQPGFLEAVVVGPLPAVLVFGFVQGFVVGGIQIVGPGG